jgi:hypothetical protein
METLGPKRRPAEAIVTQCCPAMGNIRRFLEVIPIFLPPMIMEKPGHLEMLPEIGSELVSPPMVLNRPPLPIRVTSTPPAITESLGFSGIVLLAIGGHWG